MAKSSPYRDFPLARSFGNRFERANLSLAQRRAGKGCWKYEFAAEAVNTLLNKIELEILRDGKARVER